MSSCNSSLDDDDDTSSILRSPQKRKEYLRKIITKAEILQDTFNDNSIFTLDSWMQETDAINLETSLDEKIHNQEEILLDSEMMSISTKVLKECTRTLTKTVASYNYIEFADKLVEYLNKLSEDESGTPNWSLLQTRIAKSFKTTPFYSTLLGTLAPLEKKEVNKRKRVVRDAQAQIKRPENITTVDKEEGPEQTVKLTKFITRYYKTNHEPLDLFKLILHPRDFEKTIENMLKISFLDRDRKVKISKDSSGLLVVRPYSKEETSQIKAGKTPNIQNVMNINMKQWRILRDTYRLKEPMIDFDK